MTILALETATQVCAVALLHDGRIEAEAAIYRPRAHAENLVPMIADVLRNGALRAGDISAVAVSSGPGSYTGLRIGVSTAKGLCAATGAELVSVPSLEALAEGVRPVLSRNDRIGAAFDARRDEAYAGLFRVAGDDMLEEVRETTTVRADGAADWLNVQRDVDASAQSALRGARRARNADGDGGHAGNVDGALFLIGTGWAKMAGALADIPHRVMAGDIARPSAVAVARLAAKKLERGDVEDVVTFEPYYLKEFVATKPKATAFEKLSF